MLASGARIFGAWVIFTCIFASAALGVVSPIPKFGDIVRDEVFWRPTDNWREGLCPWSDDCV